MFFGMTRPEIESDSIVSLPDALYTQPLIGFHNAQVSSFPVLVYAVEWEGNFETRWTKAYSSTTLQLKCRWISWAGAKQTENTQILLVLSYLLQSIINMQMINLRTSCTSMNWIFLTDSKKRSK